MQIQDIISPTYSINSNILRLNSSSVASSTPGCDLKGPIVYFEEFAQNSNSIKAMPPKKRLTIEINESYNFQQHSQLIQNTPMQSLHSSPHIKNSDLDTLDIVKEGESDLWMQKLNKLKVQLQINQKQKQQLLKQNQQLHAQLKKKDQIISVQMQRNEQLVLQKAQTQEQLKKQKFYDERLREKQSKFRELQKIHEKVVGMNKNLQRQLHQSERKIMELERQIQRSVCNTQIQNLTKIKQSSVKLKESIKVFSSTVNKENTVTNIVKSLQKKKTVSQIKKTGRIASSTSNIAKKLQIKNP